MYFRRTFTKTYYGRGRYGRYGRRYGRWGRRYSRRRYW